jgi:hypothetical protein
MSKDGFEEATPFFNFGSGFLVLNQKFNFTVVCG